MRREAPTSSGGSAFVSYSRTDSSLVTPIVRLLRANNDVHYDIDSTPPGTRWSDELLNAIDGASHVYVLWCTHSEGSDEVRKEYEHAVRDRDKRVVPVLLDSTPVAKPLRQYEWVDFRPVVGATHSSLRIGYRRRMLLTILGLVFAVTVAFFALNTPNYSIDPGPGPAPSNDTFTIVALAALFVAVLVWLVSVALRSRQRRRVAAQVADGLARDLVAHT